MYLLMPVKEINLATARFIIICDLCELCLILNVVKRASLQSLFA